MEDSCLKLDKVRVSFMLLTAFCDTILVIFLVFYIAKYVKKFGKERDPYFLTAVLFIFVQMCIRLLANLVLSLQFLFSNATIDDKEM